MCNKCQQNNYYCKKIDCRKNDWKDADCYEEKDYFIERKYFVKEKKFLVEEKKYDGCNKKGNYWN